MIISQAVLFSCVETVCEMQRKEGERGRKAEYSDERKRTETERKREDRRMGGTSPV